MKVDSRPVTVTSSSTGADEGEGDEAEVGGEVIAVVSTGFGVASVEVTATDAAGDGVGAEMGASLFLLVLVCAADSLAGFDPGSCLGTVSAVLLEGWMKKYQPPITASAATRAKTPIITGRLLVMGVGDDGGAVGAAGEEGRWASTTL